MEPESFLALMFGFAVILGVAGITMRLSLKPIVDSVARLMEAKTGGAQGDTLKRRIDLIEQELENLRHSQQLLLERQDFHERLKRPE